MVNESRALQRFMEMVQINSVSKNERQMADFLLDHFKSLGYQVIEDLKSQKQVDGASAGNVLVYVPGQGDLIDAPTILLCAHMDTVEPGNNIKPRLSEDGKYVISDGTTILGADDKGGIAQIVEIIQILREQKLSHPPLELLFPICEEIRLLGTRALDTTKIHAKIAYVLDGGPDVGDVLIGGPTAYDVQGKIIGKSAHAGVEPELGISSIQVLGKAIAQMKLLKVDEDTSSNIGFVSTAYPLNVVPEITTFGFEVRSLKDDKAQKQLDHLMETVEVSCQEYGARVEWEINKVLTAYRIAGENPVLKHYHHICQLHGIEVKETISRGGTDLSSLIAHGIDGIVIATGGESPHMLEERLNIDIFIRSISLLLKLITTAM